MRHQAQAMYTKHANVAGQPTNKPTTRLTIGVICRCVVRLGPISGTKLSRLQPAAPRISCCAAAPPSTPALQAPPPAAAAAASPPPPIALSLLLSAAAAAAALLLRRGGSASRARCRSNMRTRSMLRIVGGGWMSSARGRCPGCCPAALSASPAPPVGLVAVALRVVVGLGWSREMLSACVVVCR